MKQYFKIALLGLVAVATIHSEEQPWSSKIRNNEAFQLGDIDAVKGEAMRPAEFREEVRKELSRGITEEARDAFAQVLYTNNAQAVQNFMKPRPWVFINEAIIGKSFVGKNLALAQYLRSEMKKQGRAFTGLIFTHWLQGAVRADAVDVVTWLLETIAQFDVKFMIGSMLNASDIVPDSKVEAYLRKTGLFFNVINENRMREHQAEKRAAEEKQRAAR